MIGTSSASINRCFKTPYRLSTFPHIRSTLIEAPTWHITIKPSQTPFVSKHHKRPTLRRTHYTRNKRIRAPSSCFNPPFFFFLFLYERKFTLPSGTDYYLVTPRYCFTSMLGSLWCSVTWVSSLFVSSTCLRQCVLVRMCLRQVFLGRLRDWVPICWLMTGRLCVTDLHLLSSVVGS